MLSALCGVAFRMPWPVPGAALGQAPAIQKAPPSPHGWPDSRNTCLVILCAGLGHFHETGLFEKGNGTFTTALPDAGIADYGSHIYVNKAILKRGSAKTERGKVKWDRIVSMTI